MIELNLERAYSFLPAGIFTKMEAEVSENLKVLHSGVGKGNDFLGWINWPSEISDSEIQHIKQAAEELKNEIEIMVVVGIGGSYLGARAVIDALSGHFEDFRNPVSRSYPRVLFAGQNLCEQYLFDLLEMLEGKSFGITVISKSGTTTEPAVAFRFLKALLEKSVGKNRARKRILAVTDAKKGALKQLADEEGYPTWVIPDNIGGRFSVLTPVGLLPIAIAGFDIQALVKGAAFMQQATALGIPFDKNPSARYAAMRNALYRQDKTIEILVNYQPRNHYLAEWWKQLFGESEGKEGKGIFPASVDFTSDLHSMGQYIQQGRRDLFETVISVKEQPGLLTIPGDQKNLDKLNYLSGKPLEEVNRMAELGTLLAHVEGQVPNIRVIQNRMDEVHLGALIYFFEKACGISGYILGVNPFNQPGVEAYKKNMFALLGKPGFEKETETLKQKPDK